jgi:hypothetical protein
MTIKSAYKYKIHVSFSYKHNKKNFKIFENRYRSLLNLRITRKFNTTRNLISHFYGIT